MPTLTTIRPDEVRTKAFRWLVDRLKADPDLRREVKVWQDWSGSGADTQAPGADVVTVRITPIFEAEEILCVKGRGASAERTYRAPIRVQIEASGPGSNVANPMNLAGLLCDAAYAIPEERLREGGISWIEPGAPAAQARDGGTSTGAFRLMVFVRR
jgi:hypothetical protein